MAKASKALKARAKKLGLRVTSGVRRNEKSAERLRAEISKIVERRKKKKSISVAKKKAKKVPNWGKAEVLTGARVLGSKGGKKSAMLRRKKKLGIMGRGCPPYGK